VRKGFVYTFFVLFVISMLIILIVLPLNLRTYRGRGQKIRTDETDYFLKSIEQDMIRAYDISTKRAAVALSNAVVSSGSALSEPKTDLIELIQEGTLNGSQSTIMEDSSIQDWKEKIQTLAQISGYSLDITLIRLIANSSIFPYISLNYLNSINLSDPRSKSSFNPLESINSLINISEIEDPLFFLRTEGKRTSAYTQCSYSFRAKQSGTGNSNKYSSSNWTSGTAALFLNNEPVSTTTNRETKIAFVKDICSYSDFELGYLEDYLGVVSQTSFNVSNPCNKGLVLSNAISGVFVLDNTLKANLTVVLVGNNVWINNIYNELIENCYFYTSDGPNFFDRFENKLVGSHEGIGHFINILELPVDLQKSSSALDFVYWNDSAYGTTHRIMGVSNVESWFKLDQIHIDLWNISSLTY